MAQLNLTLNQEEILQLISTNRPDAFKKLLEDSLNAVLRAESAEQLGAEPYERTEDRKDSRNGVRDRELKTRIGTITLHVPRHRNQPFKTMVFENYSRSEAALVAGMAEMVVNGVSTRKVSQVMETLCGVSYSKSTVSEVCKELDAAVESFRNRPLQQDYPFLILDATYFKVRQDHRVISKALMVAYGVNEGGQREIIGFGVYPNESRETWGEFLKSLKKRGLCGMLMIVSDAHEGIRHAISTHYPEVPWQRCQFHFSRNIIDKVPKKYQKGIASELQEMFQAKTIEEARQKRDEIIANYKDVSEKAMECLEDGFESAITVMLLPEYLRRFFRTSNHIERLNRELKRRSKVIGVFSNETSLLRLMGSVLMERNEALQGMKVMFKPEFLEKLKKSEVPKNLVQIAIEQRGYLAA